MKKMITHYPHLSKRMIFAGFFVLLVFSCSKNTDNPANTAAKFCGTINWSNTLKLSGYFKGELINDKYGLTSANITDDGSGKTTTLSRDGSGHLVNQVGWNFTYDQDNLVKIVAADGIGSGTGTFTFDTNSHLKSLVLYNNDNSETSTATWNYTYDNNDDPVKITGHLESTSSTGTIKADYIITADYLTDKPNFISLVPEVAPFTIYFAYNFYLSKHLINKWVINITGKDEDDIALTPINFTLQYTYTYDSNDRVSTMVHTGNSSNKFTFTYSDCN